MKNNIINIIVLYILFIIISVSGLSDRIEHRGQQLFLSGANIAWRSFADDVGEGETDFSYFDTMFEEVSNAGGNCMRWWLHTNGANNPVFDTNDVCIGLEHSHIYDMQRVLDMAMSEDILIIICLWSFDMLKESYGTEVTDRSYKLLHDTTFTRAYIDNALIPMVGSLKDHPAIVSWEIFNEPEGMSEEFGWGSIVHVPMLEIQRFVNLCSGAIHRTDPDAKVTNGCWSFDAQTDELGLKNYYTDAELIAAGGDPDGYLDFYQVHYYTHLGIELSPFENPAYYWNLDKPLIIGEFFADDSIFNVAADDLFDKLFRTGYAGALGWQYNEDDLRPGIIMNMQLIAERYPDNVNWIVENYKPEVMIGIPDTIIDENSGDIIGFVNLKDIFFDSEDSTNLTFSVDRNSNPDLVTPIFQTSGQLDLNIKPDAFGIADILIRAEDSEGYYTLELFRVSVRDKDAPNMALLRPVTVSSTEEDATNFPNMAVDGDTATRWSSVFEDSQWIYVDLGSVREFNQVVLNWEVAFGRIYEIQISDDAVNWTTVFTETSGNGKKDEIFFDTVSSRYVKMNGIKRATQWGFSLWEFEVYISEVGIRDRYMAIPYKFSLKQNYTNQLNPVIEINYELPESDDVKLIVYGALGREIKTLVNKKQIKGRYSVIWNGFDNNGKSVSSGVYFIKFNSSNFEKACKIIIFK